MGFTECLLYGSLKGKLLATVSSKPQNISGLRNSLQRSLSGERWIKDDMQADDTPNKTTVQVQ